MIGLMQLINNLYLIRSTYGVYDIFVVHKGRIFAVTWKIGEDGFFTYHFYLIVSLKLEHVRALRYLFKLSLVMYSENTNILITYKHYEVLRMNDQLKEIDSKISELHDRYY